MSFPITYQATMTEVANLAQDRNEPGYVRVRALVALVRELSPLNERHHEVKRELGIEETPRPERYVDRAAESRAYVKGYNDGLTASESCECECTCEDEQAEAEDDDPP